MSGTRGKTPQELQLDLVLGEIEKSINIIAKQDLITSQLLSARLNRLKTDVDLLFNKMSPDELNSPFTESKITDLKKRIGKLNEDVVPLRQKAEPILPVKSKKQKKAEKRKKKKDEKKKEKAAKKKAEEEKLEASRATELTASGKGKKKVDNLSSTTASSTTLTGKVKEKKEETEKKSSMFGFITRTRKEKGKDILRTATHAASTNPLVSSAPAASAPAASATSLVSSAPAAPTEPPKQASPAQRKDWKEQESDRKKNVANKLVDAMRTEQHAAYLLETRIKSLEAEPAVDASNQPRSRLSTAVNDYQKAINSEQQAAKALSKVLRNEMLQSPDEAPNTVEGLRSFEQKNTVARVERKQVAEHLLYVAQSRREAAELELSISELHVDAINNIKDSKDKDAVTRGQELNEVAARSTKTREELKTAIDNFEKAPPEEREKMARLVEVKKWYMDIIHMELYAIKTQAELEQRLVELNLEPEKNGKDIRFIKERLDSINLLKIWLKDETTKLGILSGEPKSQFNLDEANSFRDTRLAAEKAAGIELTRTFPKTQRVELVRTIPDVTGGLTDKELLQRFKDAVKTEMSPSSDQQSVAAAQLEQLALIDQSRSKLLESNILDKRREIEKLKGHDTFKKLIADAHTEAFGLTTPVQTTVSGEAQKLTQNLLAARANVYEIIEQIRIHCIKKRELIQGAQDSRIRLVNQLTDERVQHRLSVLDDQESILGKSLALAIEKRKEAEEAINTSLILGPTIKLPISDNFAERFKETFKEIKTGEFLLHLKQAEIKILLQAYSEEIQKNPSLATILNALSDPKNTDMDAFKHLAEEAIEIFNTLPRQAALVKKQQAVEEEIPKRETLEAQTIAAPPLTDEIKKELAVLRELLQKAIVNPTIDEKTRQAITEQVEKINQLPGDKSDGLKDILETTKNSVITQPPYIDRVKLEQTIHILLTDPAVQIAPGSPAAVASPYAATLYARPKPPPELTEKFAADLRTILDEIQNVSKSDDLSSIAGKLQTFQNQHPELFDHPDLDILIDGLTQLATRQKLPELKVLAGEVRKTFTSLMAAEGIQSPAPPSPVSSSPLSSPAASSASPPASPQLPASVPPDQPYASEEKTAATKIQNAGQLLIDEKDATKRIALEWSREANHNFINAARYARDPKNPETKGKLIEAAMKMQEAADACLIAVRRDPPNEDEIYIASNQYVRAREMVKIAIEMQQPTQEEQKSKELNERYAAEMRSIDALNNYRAAIVTQKDASEISRDKRNVTAAQFIPLAYDTLYDATSSEPAKVAARELLGKARGLNIPTTEDQKSLFDECKSFQHVILDDKKAKADLSRKAAEVGAPTPASVSAAPAASAPAAAASQRQPTALEEAADRDLAAARDIFSKQILTLDSKSSTGTRTATEIQLQAGQLLVDTGKFMVEAARKGNEVEYQQLKKEFDAIRILENAAKIERSAYQAIDDAQNAAPSTPVSDDLKRDAALKREKRENAKSLVDAYLEQRKMNVMLQDKAQNNETTREAAQYQSQIVKQLIWVAEHLQQDLSPEQRAAYIRIYNLLKQQLQVADQYRIALRDKSNNANELLAQTQNLEFEARAILFTHNANISRDDREIKAAGRISFVAKELKKAKDEPLRTALVELYKANQDLITQFTQGRISPSGNQTRLVEAVAKKAAFAFAYLEAIKRDPHIKAELDLLTNPQLLADAKSLIIAAQSLLNEKVPAVREMHANIYDAEMKVMEAAERYREALVNKRDPAEEYHALWASNFIAEAHKIIYETSLLPQSDDTKRITQAAKKLSERAQVLKDAPPGTRKGLAEECRAIQALIHFAKLEDAGKRNNDPQRRVAEYRREAAEQEVTALEGVRGADSERKRIATDKQLTAAKKLVESAAQLGKTGTTPEAIEAHNARQALVKAADEYSKLSDDSGLLPGKRTEIEIAQMRVDAYDKRRSISALPQTDALKIANDNINKQIQLANQAVAPGIDKKPLVAEMQAVRRLINLAVDEDQAKRNGLDTSGLERARYAAQMEVKAHERFREAAPPVADLERVVAASQLEAAQGLVLAANSLLEEPGPQRPDKDRARAEYDAYKSYVEAANAYAESIRSGDDAEKKDKKSFVHSAARHAANAQSNITTISESPDNEATRVAKQAAENLFIEAKRLQSQLPEPAERQDRLAELDLRSKLFSAALDESTATDPADREAAKNVRLAREMVVKAHEMRNKAREKFREAKAEDPLLSQEKINAAGIQLDHAQNLVIEAEQIARPGHTLSEDDKRAFEARSKQVNAADEYREALQPYANRNVVDAKLISRNDARWLPLAYEYDRVAKEKKPLTVANPAAVEALTKEREAAGKLVLIAKNMANPSMSAAERALRANECNALEQVILRSREEAAIIQAGKPDAEKESATLVRKAAEEVADATAQLNNSTQANREKARALVESAVYKYQKANDLLEAAKKFSQSPATQAEYGLRIQSFNAADDYLQTLRKDNPDIQAAKQLRDVTVLNNEASAPHDPAAFAPGNQERALEAHNQAREAAGRLTSIQGELTAGNQPRQPLLARADAEMGLVRAARREETMLAMPESGKTQASQEQLRAARDATIAAEERVTAMTFLQPSEPSGTEDYMRAVKNQQNAIKRQQDVALSLVDTAEQQLAAVNRLAAETQADKRDRLEAEVKDLKAKYEAQKELVAAWKAEQQAFKQLAEKPDDTTAQGNAARIAQERIAKERKALEAATEFATQQSKRAADEKAAAEKQAKDLEKQRADAVIKKAGEDARIAELQKRKDERQPRIDAAAAAARQTATTDQTKKAEEAVREAETRARAKVAENIAKAKVDAEKKLRDDYNARKEKDKTEAEKQAPEKQKQQEDAIKLAKKNAVAALKPEAGQPAVTAEAMKAAEDKAEAEEKKTFAAEAAVAAQKDAETKKQEKLKLDSDIEAAKNATETEFQPQAEAAVQAAKTKAQQDAEVKASAAIDAAEKAAVKKASEEYDKETEAVTKAAKEQAEAAKTNEFAEKQKVQEPTPPDKAREQDIKLEKAFIAAKEKADAAPPLLPKDFERIHHEVDLNYKRRLDYFAALTSRAYAHVGDQQKMDDVKNATTAMQVDLIRYINELNTRLAQNPGKTVRTNLEKKLKAAENCLKKINEIYTNLDQITQGKFVYFGDHEAKVCSYQDAMNLNQQYLKTPTPRPAQGSFETSRDGTWTTTPKFDNQVRWVPLEIKLESTVVRTTTIQRHDPVNHVFKSDFHFDDNIASLLNVKRQKGTINLIPTSIPGEEVMRFVISAVETFRGANPYPGKAIKIRTQGMPPEVAEGIVLYCMMKGHDFVHTPAVQRIVDSVSDRQLKFLEERLTHQASEMISHQELGISKKTEAEMAKKTTPTLENQGPYETPQND